MPIGVSRHAPAIATGRSGYMRVSDPDVRLVIAPEPRPRPVPDAGIRPARLRRGIDPARWWVLRGGRERPGLVERTLPPHLPAAGRPSRRIRCRWPRGVGQLDRPD